MGSDGWVGGGWVWVQVLVVEAFVVGSNVGVDDDDDEVGAKVKLFEEARVAGGFWPPPLHSTWLDPQSPVVQLP